ANIEVILNRESKHGMRGTGVGTLFMNINTLGKFEMTGDFQVWDGYYNFKYGGLIDKKFKVKRFGSIVWEGNPYRAQLNLEAVSQNITANPAVLVENASFNRKIPVDVVISLKGTVLAPEPDFAINFPNVSSVMRSEIETKLSDRDTRQTQALYLLSTGGFLSPEGLSQSQITNSFYEKAGALFGDLFNDKEGKFILDVTYSQADRTALTPTDGRLVANITTQINDRITINGRVGVPTGGVSQTAIVGNFEAQYRVNEDGTLNLRVFNRENDINYIGQGVGYTQGAGVSYEVDFDTFNELIKKIFGKKAVQVESASHDLPADSGHLPDYIDMETGKEKKEKSQELPKPNQEAVPHDD
ncbi:translocation/assembly module TamB domain-containing protein, partial [Flavobacterium sp.]